MDDKRLDSSLTGSKASQSWSSDSGCQGEVVPRKRPRSGVNLSNIKEKNGNENVLVSSRCSISHLHDCIAGLTDRKKELVKSIGFEGLLLFPNIRQLNRRFILWLMNKVDPLTPAMVIGSTRKIVFDKEDVARVFGIPSQGLSVADNGKPGNEVVASIKRAYLGIDPKDNHSIKAAQDVIERNYDRSMTDEDETAFKVAFVIYVMDTLLSPGAKYDYAPVDYWNCLQEPSKIPAFDCAMKYESNWSNLCLFYWHIQWGF
ncbi:hypothetical protein GQ55_6G110700 [Panicum hallii var. hallii]|uniref:Aminotransferase-like plant mobile domain-containing protein n=1 Tax=Panicum hallii var. hallii TaxID=1504633 RepID=A0A2T7D5Q9_9POAL|nr:hypothetical protein GQ55_6G110700 [Panicum hallii var. hallii]